MDSYGETVFKGHNAFCVNWVNVGYYSGGTDKLNSFQLLLVDKSDKGAGAFDIVFNYDKIQWEVGSGKWEVGSGKWEVGSGKWEVRSGNGKRERRFGRRGFGV